MNRNIRNLIVSATNLITKGDGRSVKVKKNILGLFLIKGGSIAISLILVPLTIHYINPSRYGIWLTLSSIIVWFSFFDIGFGHGLRNKFADALARGKEEEAKIYVSTTYAALAVIVTGILLLFLVVNPFLNWAVILNAPPELAEELSILALIVFVFFCIQFVLQLLITVLTANHEPAKGTLLATLGNLLALLIIFLLTKTTSGNLILLGLSLSVSPVIILALATLWFYRKSYRKYAPSIKYVRKEYIQELMGLGWQFFVINITVLVMLNTDNIIITQVLGPEKVTTFNVTHKLFSVVSMIFFLIATPLWSAYTDAYAKQDFRWIKNTLQMTRKIWLVLLVCTIIVLLLSPVLFKVWLGDSVQVPFALSIAMSTYAIAYVWQTLHTFLLNGIGKIRLQLYLAVFFSLIHIPLAIYLGKHFGLVGITLLGTFIFLVTGAVYAVQIHKVLNHTASNIWNA
jgi:O-antigen/teichoic acid export membrane protein